MCYCVFYAIEADLMKLSKAIHDSYCVQLYNYDCMCASLFPPINEHSVVRYDFVK